MTRPAFRNHGILSAMVIAASIPVGGPAAPPIDVPKPAKKKNSVQLSDREPRHKSRRREHYPYGLKRNTEREQAAIDKRARKAAKRRPNV